MTGGAVVSEVGQLIALSNTQGGTPTPKVEPAPLLARDITWKLKDSWTVGETIDKASIGLGVSAGPDNAALTAPLPAKLAKGGVSVSVTAVAPAAEGYAEATLSKTVAVQKLKPLITWATPYPVEAGTKLSARELDADIAPPELRPRLVYAPKANDTLATVGVKTLKVSYAGDDGHEAASAQVSLKVVDGPEELAPNDRCLIGSRGSGGPGMLNNIYNSNYRFLSTPDAFVVVVEMGFGVRTVPILASKAAAQAAHAPAALHPWMGDSTAWWEGDTLVIETVNVHPQQGAFGPIFLSETGRVTERLTRTAKEIAYEFVVEDPVHYTQTWKAEMTLYALDGDIYEYACHEGNYALTGILGGARAKESASGGAP